MEDFKDHPSVQQIQQETDNGKQTINVNPVMQGQALAVLESLNIRKATGIEGILAKVLKIGAEELSKPLTTLFNSCIGNSVWPLRLEERGTGPRCIKKTISSPRRTIDQLPSSHM